MRVGVHYHSSEQGARRTVAQIEGAGGESRLIQADLTSSGAAEGLVNEAAAALGGLDVLINSAAVMVRTPLDEVTEAEWDSMFALNLRAPFFAARAAARQMTGQGRKGAIVNITDLAAFESWPAFIPHGISKAGLVQATRAMAQALAPGIRVNAVAPGAVLLPEECSPDVAQRLTTTTPLGRLGSPADVVGAVLYLLEADYVTGETLIVDGGRHVRC